MKKSSYIAAVLMLIIISIVGCEPDTVCHINLQCSACVEAVRKTYDFNGTERIALNWDSARVKGIGSDSVLVWDKQTDAIYLPMRADSGVTAYEIMWHEMTDTLVMFSTYRLEFISMACGCMVPHTLDSVAYTTHFIDSLLILERDITNNKNVSHMLVYLHPEDESAEEDE